MLADTLRALAGARLRDEDGDEQIIELLPPATAEELLALEAGLPAPLPREIREALMVSKGLANGPLESFSLVDLEGFGLEEMFPYAYSIAHDGFGNYWVLDLLPTSTGWSPVYYVCHDPPVVVWQAATIDEFLQSAIAMWQPGPRSAVDLVHDDSTATIWRSNPLARPRDEIVNGADAALRSFAEAQPPTALIADLRNAATGDGFSWGVFGPRTDIRRWGTEPVWAAIPPEKRPGFFSRLFGRSDGRTV